MAGRINESESHYPERKHRRFNLRYSVVLRFPPGSALRELGDLQTMSRNVSIGGLLVDAACSIPIQSQVSLTIVVERTEEPVRFAPIRLESEGKVVRIEPQPGGRFAVAIEYSRPLTQIGPHLAAGND